MNNKTCVIEGCGDKVLCREWCSKHYQRWYKHGDPEALRPDAVEQTCAFCGSRFKSSHKLRMYCESAECESRRRSATRIRHAWLLVCVMCGSEYTGSRKDGKYCPDCRGRAVSESRSPQNAAIYDAVRSGSRRDVLDAIRGRCEITASGCWEWQGFRSASGYGYVSTGRTRRRPQENTHRVTYEYATGASVEGMTVHHKCANPPCCNPDHLQLATHRDNMAEMYARKTYETQIAQLRSALAEHAPDHPLLA